MAFIDREVASAFGVRRQARRMFGSERRTYLARATGRTGTDGLTVLRNFGLEPQALLRQQWKCDVLAALGGDGFRADCPVRARDGKWIVGGWTAWRFLEGKPATADDAAAVLLAVEALHRALSRVPFPPAHALRPVRADRVSWGDDPLPPCLPPTLAEPLERLAALRRPIEGLRPQLIHGDLHYTNILIAPGAAPAFIDWGLYWRPPEYAAAIAAYWLGPNSGDETVLRHFERVPHLEQLVVRVAMRQLLFFVERGIPAKVPELGRFGLAAQMVCRLIEG